MKTKKLKKKEIEDIEFNNGFITAIGLFLSHERNEWNKEETCFTLYGATDHLFDMEIPRQIPKKLRERINNAKELALSLRLSNPKKEQVKEVFREFKEILKDLDEFLFNKEVYIGFY